LNLFYSRTAKISQTFTCLLCTGILLLAAGPGFSQDPDTITADPEAKNHNPRKAVFYSAMVPGLGQVYNQKYWKVPFIYGAGGALAYFVVFNQDKYKKFREAIDKGDTGELVFIDGSYYDFEILPRGRDYYRRNRDLCALGTAAIYFLNIIDAMVDANFFYYDVSDDLSLHFQPVMLKNPGFTAAVGFQIDIGF